MPPQAGADAWLLSVRVSFAALKSETLRRPFSVADQVTFMQEPRSSWFSVKESYDSVNSLNGAHTMIGVESQHAESAPAPLTPFSLDHSGVISVGQILMRMPARLAIVANVASVGIVDALAIEMPGRGSVRFPEHLR